MQAVLFDLDDTLFATIEAKWAQHKTVAATEFGIEITDEVMHQHWGKPLRVLLREFYGDIASETELLDRYSAYDHLFPKRPFPGAAEALTRLLDSGVAAGIVTSTLHTYAVRDLQRNDFPLDRLAVVQGEDDITAHKPDPAVFEPPLARLHELGVNRADVTYIGDSLIDLNAAASAGLPFIGVATGLLSAEQLALAGAPRVADGVVAAIDMVMA